MNLISLIISGIALTISGITAWLTLFHKGTIRMTRPTLIFFGFDERNIDLPKIYLRTLLYSTSKKGQIVESMFVRLHRNESIQTFNIWVYGEKSLFRGSGINVDDKGVVYNHHFLLPKDGTKYAFLSGDYTIKVYASLVNNKNPILLSEEHVHLLKEESDKLLFGSSGIFFDWGPDSGKYHSHIDQKPE